MDLWLRLQLPDEKATTRCDSRLLPFHRNSALFVALTFPRPFEPNIIHTPTHTRTRTSTQRDDVPCSPNYRRS